jgi:guanine deaminase
MYASRGGASLVSMSDFLEQAIELAAANVRREGGPFAALVVRDGVVIASGTNQVTRGNDPTAHAEIVAIREACRALGGFQLSGCDVYSSCEPCPMCLGALYWARPARVFFAASAQDAAAAGFDDAFIYGQIQAPPAARAIPMIHIPHERARLPFEAWANKPDRTKY